MNDEILIRYRWTVDELLAGHRWHFRHRMRPLFRWIYWLLASTFIFFGAYQWRQTHSWSGGGFLLAVGLYIFLLLLVIRPWLLRRRFAKRPDRDAEVEWRISADSIHVQAAHGSSDFIWAALAKVVQTPVGFLFYPTEQMFHWLPRHGFASDAEFDRLAELAQRQAKAFHRSA